MPDLLLAFKDAPLQPAQLDRLQHVPCLVRAYLRLRSDTRCDLNLHNQAPHARKSDDQSVGLRRHLGVPAEPGAGRERPLPGGPERGSGSGRPSMSTTWGFEETAHRRDRNPQSLGRIRIRPLLKGRPRLDRGEQLRGGPRVVSNVQRARDRRRAPPREFVLIDRAAIGPGSMFTHLQARSTGLSCSWS